MGLLALLTPPLLAHVPTYTNVCNNNCCEPPHTHTISQVVYLKNDGGLELHNSDLKIDGDGELIDFDIVFREKYDTSTFDLYVGCGGCASGPDEIDPFLIAPIAKPSSYQNGKLEAFTQTGYFPLLPSGEQRQFDTRLLQSCTDKHWSIRLVRHANATQTIVWGAVVGCDGFECESFTLIELLSFPLYVLWNHGPVWNDLEYTIAIAIPTALFCMIIVCGYWWGGLLVLKAPAPYVTVRPRRAAIARREMRKFPGRSRWVDLPDQDWVWSPRCILYAFAMWALISDLIETLIHFSVASAQVGATDQLGYGLFFGVVLTFGKLIPILMVSLIWGWHREIPEYVWRNYVWGSGGCTWWTDWGFYSPMWASGWWWWLELIGLGLAGFIWLGAGYWVFPSAMTIAAIYRGIRYIYYPLEYDNVTFKELASPGTDLVSEEKVPLQGSEPAVEITITTARFHSVSLPNLSL